MTEDEWVTEISEWLTTRVWPVVAAIMFAGGCVMFYYGLPAEKDDPVSAWFILSIPAIALGFVGVLITLVDHGTEMFHAILGWVYRLGAPNDEQPKDAPPPQGDWH